MARRIGAVDRIIASRQICCISARRRRRRRLDIVALRAVRLRETGPDFAQVAAISYDRSITSKDIQLLDRPCRRAHILDADIDLELVVAVMGLNDEIIAVADELKIGEGESARGK